MLKYPIREKEKGYISVEEAYKLCNQSYCDGFITAHCETAEEYESITPADRIAFCLEAIERNAIIRRENPKQPNFSGGGTK